LFTTRPWVENDDGYKETPLLKQKPTGKAVLSNSAIAPTACDGPVRIQPKDWTLSIRWSASKTAHRGLIYSITDAEYPGL